VNCREARRCLSPYLDSELDPTTTFAISEHLRTCDPCRWRFDAERDVDQCMVSRLNMEGMPDDLWRGIIRPVRRWHLIRGRFLASLAAAALVAFVAWAYWPWTSDAAPPHRLVREFLAETDGGRPYPADPAMTVSAGTRMALGPFADLVVNFSDEVARKHVVQLVTVTTVQDADGSDVVELRLNCCGQPVLVRAARRDRPGPLREFLGADDARLAALPTTARVAFAEREVGEYVVVAMSRHPVRQLLAAIRVN